MTDTGRFPDEGQPENAGALPGHPLSADGAAPADTGDPSAYSYLDHDVADEDDLLLMPGAQGAWSEQPAASGGTHETGGRDTGSLDYTSVRAPAQAAAPTPPRRPLHLGPPVPEPNSGVVRSLADRGPAAPQQPVGSPVRPPAPPVGGVEYLDVPPVDGVPHADVPPLGAPPVDVPPVAFVPPQHTADAVLAAPDIAADGPAAAPDGGSAAAPGVPAPRGPETAPVMTVAPGAAQALVDRVAPTPPAGTPLGGLAQADGAAGVAAEAPVEAASAEAVPAEAVAPEQGPAPVDVPSVVDVPADAAVPGDVPSAEAGTNGEPTGAGTAPEPIPAGAQVGESVEEAAAAVADGAQSAEPAEPVAGSVPADAPSAAAPPQETAPAVEPQATDGEPAVPAPAPAQGVPAGVRGMGVMAFLDAPVPLAVINAMPAPEAATGSPAAVVAEAQTAVDGTAAGGGQPVAVAESSATGAVQAAVAAVDEGAAAQAAAVTTQVVDAAAIEDAVPQAAAALDGGVPAAGQAADDSAAGAGQPVPARSDAADGNASLPTADASPTEGTAADGDAVSPAASATGGEQPDAAVVADVAAPAQAGTDVAGAPQGPVATLAPANGGEPSDAVAASQAVVDGTAPAQTGTVVADAPQAAETEAAADAAAQQAAPAPDVAAPAQSVSGAPQTADAAAPETAIPAAEDEQPGADGTAPQAAPVAEGEQPVPVAAASEQTVTAAPPQTAADVAAPAPAGTAGTAEAAAVAAAPQTAADVAASAQAGTAVAGAPQSAEAAVDVAAPGQVGTAVVGAPQSVEADAVAAGPQAAASVAEDESAADVAASAQAGTGVADAPQPAEAAAGVAASAQVGTAVAAAPQSAEAAPVAKDESAADVAASAQAGTAVVGAPQSAEAAADVAASAQTGTAVADAPQSAEAVAADAESAQAGSVVAGAPQSAEAASVAKDEQPGADGSASAQTGAAEAAAVTPHTASDGSAPAQAETAVAGAPRSAEAVAPQAAPGAEGEQPAPDVAASAQSVSGGPQTADVTAAQAAAPVAEDEPAASVAASAQAGSAVVGASQSAEAVSDAAAAAANGEQPAPDGAPVIPQPAAGAPVGDPADGYADAERAAVHRVMRERRDIRKGFRRDPVPPEVLLRVLEAAHTAPSVGHSQPWDFVVIRSAETRKAMHELVARQREAYAKSLPKARAKQFKELKIEAILDTPVNIVVTADPTRGGRHTLGRHTQPQMAPYSSALAVENLWLAARAEGLGVGWVSFFDEREMVRALGLPEHLEVVAYLCVGYVDEFPDEPELLQAGWSKRRPLSWVVHEEEYGRRALPGEDPHDLLAETLRGIRPLDAKALGEAWERQKRMTKPSGALGMLEIISAQLCGLSRKCPPPIPEPAAVAIFAGDHGVHNQGVTAWPQEVTSQMVANFLGGGAVCNAFANQVGAEVCVVDVGVAGELPSTPGLLPRKIRPGTNDFTTGPAMTREEAMRALEVGIETARDLVTAGNKALLTGEMGIANTTVSAALIAVYTGADPAEITGRGTGINDEMHARKVDVVRRALELHQPDPKDPIGVLAAIGGLEHAAMVGLILGGASLRTPVILDGVSAGAAALVARAIAPEALAACIAGHRSAEPGHVAALTKLGLRPLVDLDLRLGEGTGALLALPVVQSAARAMHEVATFDTAGVSEKS
ncbi:nicotinate-nucleotide--dimethylbenzimidazole phosphoribosyltransferase [Streptomyces abikoensis]|uniref:nicotinate-nucleotide--dimethylbenzimidazole phosphoribosyltransferase n=1 Tax=Streptomyces abikoensis TaxID=97398 RepID=UPI0033C885A0